MCGRRCGERPAPRRRRQHHGAPRRRHRSASTPTSTTRPARPALEAVAARVTEVLPLYASVHRGAGYLSQVSTALYESARQTIARFVDARPDDVAIITRNTTDSLNLLARRRPGGLPGARPRHRAPRQPAALGALGATATATRRRSCRSRAPSRRRSSKLRDELARQHYALLTVTGASNVTGESLPARRGHRPRARRGHARRRRRRPAGAAPRVLARGHRRRLHRVLGPQDLRTVRGRRPGRSSRLARHGLAVPRRGRCGARRADRSHGLAAGAGPARGRLAQRDRRDRARGGLRPARRPARRRPGRARGGPARAARRRAVRDRRRRDRAHLARLRRRPSAC